MIGTKLNKGILARSQAKTRKSGGTHMLKSSFGKTWAVQTKETLKSKLGMNSMNFSTLKTHKTKMCLVTTLGAPISNKTLRLNSWTALRAAQSNWTSTNELFATLVGVLERPKDQSHASASSAAAEDQSLATTGSKRDVLSATELDAFPNNHAKTVKVWVSKGKFLKSKSIYLRAW